MLQTNGLEKKFKNHPVIKGISFDVEKGESYGLLGPNGAGKTTLIHMMSGLLHPSKGDVLIGGTSIVEDRKKAQRQIGIVPQEIALYLDFSAKDNLLFWGKLYGLKGEKLKKRMEQVLEIVGLVDRQKEKVHTFSGGMKRRLNIGCALLHEPALLIMDEPTVGIDPQSRHHILETIKQLNHDGMTVIYTSHYMEEVQHLCTKVGILDHGQLLAEGNIEEIKTMFGALSELHLKVEGKYRQLPEELSEFSVKEMVEQEGKWVLFNEEPVKILPDLMYTLKKIDCRLLSLDIKEPNLESVFLQLTGRKLRD